jgi:CubicO group peptidase (beta-lactamase class C family)
MDGSMPSFSRRSFLSKGAFATVAAAGAPNLWSGTAHAEIPMPRSGSPLAQKLDAYIAAYMPAMNAPGLTLGLADTSGTIRTAAYGYSNLDLQSPVTVAHLFQIGSITKSFVALVLLQLREEGKLDLHKPVLDYLPWLPITQDFGPITTHHLLTHASGLPDSQSIFSSDPNARLAQAFKPGEHFHYCNAGFNALGLLVEKLDGRPWRDCVQERIFSPLEMTESTGILTTASRERMVVSYHPFWDDQVYPRHGKLAPAPNLVMDDTAGCIASTPADMARYLRMLLNGGKTPLSRIVSEESFKLFSTPYIKAEEFSPTASYGYGIAVDTLEGHKILRHTGGMVSFASSIHVDLDGGVAAFASINAMQGYRPTAVTEYSVRLLRAQHESKSLPEAPTLADPQSIDNAADYAGTFSTANGGSMVFEAQGKRLMLKDESRSIPLQHTGGDSFISTVPGRFAEYGIEFGRKENGSSADMGQGTSGSGDAPKGRVTEVSYGPRWFTNAAYTGPHNFEAPKAYAAYVGCYRSDSAWGGHLRVYILKDQLVLEGTPLTRLGNSLFRAGDEPWTPDTAEFLIMAEGKARLLKFTGLDFWRVEVE